VQKLDGSIGNSASRCEVKKTRCGTKFLFLAVVLILGAMWGEDADVAQGNSAPAFTGVSHADRDRIVVLGLGAGPVMWPDRNNTGFLLIVNGAEYMIDCGAGTPNAIFKAGLGFGPLDNLFFTHYHFDHYSGYLDLLARGYLTIAPSKLDSLDVWGPPGLQKITDCFMEGLAIGAELHNWNPIRPNLPTVPTVHEFDLPETGIELVYEDSNVTVRATRVDHDMDVPNAYAYRFDIKNGPSAGKSVVFSGDTRKNDQLIALAQDATVLVHEVSKDEWADKIAPVGSPLYNHLINSHTDVSEIPEIAKKANCGMVVLSHYGNIDAEYTLAQAAGIILEDVMKANANVGYKGRIIAPYELDMIGF
jgi:ribonuclease BN (tRNA processing enzyme)